MREQILTQVWTSQVKDEFDLTKLDPGRSSILTRHGSYGQNWRERNKRRLKQDWKKTGSKHSDLHKGSQSHGQNHMDGFCKHHTHQATGLHTRIFFSFTWLKVL